MPKSLATIGRYTPAGEPPGPRLDTGRSAHIISGESPRWRNWQTHYFEVVAPQGVQVQILSWALNPSSDGFLFAQTA